MKKSKLKPKPKAPKAPQAPQAQSGRRDRRYLDQTAAPTIVSEKRVTIFMPQAAYNHVRRLTGMFQVAQASGGNKEQELPESPSALIREAVDYLLDQYRKPEERVHTPAEWEKRIAATKDALKHLTY